MFKRSVFLCVCALWITAQTVSAENVVKLSMDFVAEDADFQVQNSETGVYYALWKKEDTESKADVLAVGLGISNFSKITMKLTKPTAANLSAYLIEISDIAYQIADSLQKLNIIGETFSVDVSSVNLYKKYKLTGETEYTWDALFPDQTKMFDDEITLLLGETESVPEDVYFTISITGKMSATALIPFKVTTNAKLDDKTMSLALFPDPKSGKAWNDPTAEKKSDEASATFSDIVKIAVNVSNSHTYSKLDFSKTEFFTPYEGYTTDDVIPLTAANTAWVKTSTVDCTQCAGTGTGTTVTVWDYDGDGKMTLKDVLKGLKALTE